VLKRGEKGGEIDIRVTTKRLRIASKRSAFKNPGRRAAGGCKAIMGVGATQTQAFAQSRPA